MDIRIKATKRALYNFPTDVAIALCEGQPEIYERLADVQANNTPHQVPPPPAADFFQVERSPHDGRVCIAHRKRTGETFLFSGLPDQAATAFGKIEVPAAIIEEYTRRHKR